MSGGVLPVSGAPSAPLRLVELLASISLATDMGTGQPLGHGLRTCAMATAIAEEVARDIELAVLSGADPAELVQERRGRAYDPAVVDVFARTGPALLAELGSGDEWERALAAELHPVVTVGIDQFDAVDLLG